MSFPSIFRLSFSLAVALALLIGADQCSAQQKSLFVIKTPDVAGTGYGKASAIKFAPVAKHQEQQITEVTDEPVDALTENLDATFETQDQSDDALMESDFDVAPEELEADEPTIWSLKPMASIAPGIRPVDGKIPSDQSSQLVSRTTMPIVNSDKLFAWAAPDITYQPLYFEDVALERYGQTRGLIRQPIASSVHFLKSAVFMPYYTLYDPINSCDGPLGYCRPGTEVNCVSQKHYFGIPLGGRK